MKTLFKDDNVRVCRNDSGDIIVHSRNSAAQLRVTEVKGALEFTVYPRFVPCLTRPDRRYGWKAY